MPLKQTECAQSVPSKQPAPAGQTGQLPPQSTPVSVPLRTLSVQLGAAQVPFVQTLLEQSTATKHRLAVPQRRQVPPPQSISVSLPFLTLSVQVGTAHLPF
jgi:hypothetical protein